MKKFTLLFSGLLLCLNVSLFAQCEFINPAVPDISLTFVGVDGTNASGVAYNPDDSLYYALIAGNAGYPLETFSKTGAPLSQAVIGFDSRGLWWNPEQHQAEINGYDAGGLYIPDMDPNGYLLGTGTNPFTGMNQPNSQSCGAFDWGDNEIIYFNSGVIHRYDRNTCTLLGTLPLSGFSNWTQVNSTSVIFTGCGGKEIGVLDYINKRVLLFRKADGSLSMTIDLPASAITNDMFRFAYANGRVWLYDVATRTWFAYRIIYESGVGIAVQESGMNVQVQADKLLITVTNGNPEEYTLCLLNAAGQSLREEPMSEHPHQLSTHGLRSGLYLLALKGKSTILTKKIILP